MMVGEINMSDDDQAQDDLLKPLTKADCPNLTQLEIDAVNVLENRLNISAFDNEYQQQILNFYRFSAVNNKSSNASAGGGGRRFWK